MDEPVRRGRGRALRTSGLTADQSAVLHETGFTPIAALTAGSVRSVTQREIEFCARALSAVQSPLSSRRDNRPRLDPHGPTSRLSSPHLQAMARAADDDWTALTRDLMRECSRAHTDGILDVHLTAVETDDGARIRYQATGTAIRHTTSSLHACQVRRGSNRIVQALFIASTILPAPRGHDRRLARGSLAPPQPAKTVVMVNPPGQITALARRQGR